MKLLFISSLYHPNQIGGAEKIVRIIAEGLVQSGHEAVVVTAQEGLRDRFAEVNGVKVYYIGLKNLYWPYSRKERSAIARASWHGIDRYNPLMARAVARVLDVEKPDVVNTHNLTGFSCAAWNAVKSRGLPLIHTLHDYSLMCPSTTMFKDGQNCPRQCGTCALYTSPSKQMSQMVDHVVGVSRFTLARHLVSGYFQAARQVHVIHNGLPGNLPTAPRHKRPERPLQLGYVGQITPVKGIRELISQMGHWQSGQCELLVAGKGATAYEAMLRAEAPKNVRFLGFVDPHQLYGSIDLLVVPSLWEEPLATTVLEAYMHGVPVIVSRRGGLPEMVDEGRTGLVYEPLRPEGLRKVVEVFIRDPQIAHDMHPLVLEKARDFLVDRMQVKYLHLFENAKEISTIKDQPRQLGRRPA